MTETKSDRNLPEGAKLLADGKHFHMPNEKYSEEKKDVKAKSNK